MKTLIIDSHNLIFRNLFVAQSLCAKDKDISNDSVFSLYKQMMLFSTLNYINRFSPDRVIFAMDSRDNWRKLVYPLYKNGRAKGREESVIDFKAFFPVNEEFYNALKENLGPIYFLNIPSCEADDVAAVLTKHLSDDDIIAVSTDEDWFQNFKYPNYKQWSPQKKDFVKILNPKMFLEMKILTGDPGDDIPDVANDIIGKKIKAAEKIYNSLDIHLLDETFAERYKRNQTLIDLTKIPEEHKKSIVDAFENYEKKPYAGRNFFSWVMNNTPGFCDNVQEFAIKVKALK